MVGWLVGCMDRWMMYGWLVGWMDRWMMYGWLVGWMDGWLVGWMDVSATPELCAEAAAQSGIIS